MHSMMNAESRTTTAVPAVPSRVTVPCAKR